MKVKRALTALIAALALACGLFGVIGCSDATESPSKQTTLKSSAASSSSSIAQDHHESHDDHLSTHHLSFRNHHALVEHFEKHGAEVGCATADEYVAAANAVIDDPDVLQKTQSDGDTAFFLESTGEFVVVSPQGFIRTYFITDRSYFNRQ